MQYAEISYQHQQAVERLRRRYGHETSSHSFAALYLWQHQMKLTIALEPDCFYIKCDWKGENAYFFPCGSPRKILAFIDGHRAERNFRLLYMRACDTAFVKQHYPGIFRCSYDDDAAEYVYSVAEQLALRGKKFIRIRTKLHHFERTCQPSVKNLDSTTAKDARAVIAHWQANRGQPGCVIDDALPSQQMISEREQLGISGIIVYLEERPAAVLGGYLLSDSTFDLCLVKEAGMVTGLDYYAKRQLYKQLSRDITLINAEEDLGLAGLRMAKKGQRPVCMAGMWEGELQ